MLKRCAPVGGRHYLALRVLIINAATLPLIMITDWDGRLKKLML
ncbi:hypothetical protein T4B_12786 [Trichinella pseudospiralis]|uniref:Uncharacterized protein n=1 Tax=Trichinella pseudospiralis TaxID=6337 RepID=A0A0V1GDP6_TRIPS|nr:hypothetical protein T4B_12786 [Trichinella pseudospiralis]